WPRLVGQPAAALPSVRASGRIVAGRLRCAVQSEVPLDRIEPGLDRRHGVPEVLAPAAGREGRLCPAGPWTGCLPCPTGLTGLTWRQHLFHPLPDPVEVTGNISHDLRCGALALANQAEQDVLGADVVMVEQHRLFLSQDDNPPRFLGEPLEHLVAPLVPC